MWTLKKQMNKQNKTKTDSKKQNKLMVAKGKSGGRMGERGEGE